MTETIDAIEVGAATPPVQRGRRRRPGRPRLLDHDTIVASAARIADTDGPAALTMTRLASELGVGVMTLYTYVRTKDDLLDEVIDTVLGQAPLPVPPEDPSQWRGVLLDTFVEIHDVMLAHAKLVETAGTRSTIGPAVTGWLEAVLRVLEATGFDEHEMVTIYRELLSYALGDTYLRTSHVPSLEAGEPSGTGGAPSRFPLVQRTVSLLREQITREQYILGLRQLLNSLPDPAGSGNAG